MIFGIYDENRIKNIIPKTHNTLLIRILEPFNITSEYGSSIVYVTTQYLFLLGYIAAISFTVTLGAFLFTADEVIRLKDKVKDAFQNNAMFIMSPATRNAIRLLKDKQDRYLLNDDISSPFGTTLLGKPVYVSDNMPEMAANAKAIYYGDFSGLATKFGEDMTIEVLREKYATQHAVGVVGWVEFDAKVEDPQKIAVLTMAAK